MMGWDTQPFVSITLPSLLPIHDSYTCFTIFLDVCKIWMYSGCKVWKLLQLSTTLFITLENEKFFELKSKGYRDGIKRKETR